MSHVRHGTRDDGTPFCRVCDVDMAPEIGQVLTTGTWLIWWRCENDPGHVTVSLPVPDVWLSARAGTIPGVMRRGEDGLQPPGVAEPPQGLLHRP